MYILGISCFFHDASACLLKDGQIVASAAEERFSRIKHDNSFPYQAIAFCLKEAGISMGEVAVVGFYEKPLIKFERILHQHLEHFPKSYKTFLRTASSWFVQKLNIKKILKKELKYRGPVWFIPHHLSHAASSFFLSSFDTASIVTIDGVGEWATTTIGRGDKKGIYIEKEIHFPHSLGLLYSTLTTYLGFSANDAEYKVMGLAAYGKPNRFRKHMSKLMRLHKDGSFRLNMKYFDFDWADHMPSKALVELFGYPGRIPESEMQEQYADIASALQEALEQAVFNILRAVYKAHKNPNLCLAGGVALNSVMNGKILTKTKFKSVYIPPDPGDAGGAMGVALYIAHIKNILGKKIPFTPYVGPGFDRSEIRKVLDKNKLKYTYMPYKKLITKVSDLITHQKVIGWFQGKMEWGPRALGARSILASASSPEMKDIINARVKHRELFRPFAPVILEQFVRKYFVADQNLSISAKWMLMVYAFKKTKAKEVPAVVHVDNTGRLETLSRGDNPMYYDLVYAHYKKTGIPIIINTSFNVRGEPIVCTPQDAIDCLRKTDIDCLVIDQFLVYKQ
jgi:carbamoyltransferase